MSEIMEWDEHCGYDPKSLVKTMFSRFVLIGDQLGGDSSRICIEDTNILVEGLPDDEDKSFPVHDFGPAGDTELRRLCGLVNPHGAVEVVVRAYLIACFCNIITNEGGLSPYDIFERTSTLASAADVSEEVVRKAFEFVRQGTSTISSENLRALATAVAEEDETTTSASRKRRR